MWIAGVCILGCVLAKAFASSSSAAAPASLWSRLAKAERDANTAILFVQSYGNVPNRQWIDRLDF